MKAKSMTAARVRRAAKPKSNGAIIYSGPSMLDGAPIVCIVVGLENQSRNAKTGAMLQTYVVRADMHPMEAIRTGADVSICGDCEARGVAGDGSDRTCYVEVWKGATAVHGAYTRGAYPVVDAAGLAAGRIVRLGTYGDPAAVPVHVWHALLDGAIAYTGYTHQWRSRPDLQALCMASVDTPEQAVQAKADGWRTFRVAMPQHPVRMPGEAVCPASAEAGKKLTCSDCRSCDGTGSSRRGTIVIQAHGPSAVMAAVRRKFGRLAA